MMRHAVWINILLGVCLLMSSAAAGPQGTNEHSRTVQPPRFAIQQLTLPVRDVVYSALTEKLYVSVPSSGGAYANSVVAVDPATGTLGGAISVGLDPTKMAVSNDGRSLYVGINGAHAIQRIDLTTGIAAAPFALGSNPQYGAYVADDIAVVPGKPNTVAVALANQTVSPRHEGVALYVDGMRLPDKTQRHTGPTILEFCGADNTLYGYNTESSEFGLYRLVLNDTGVRAEMLARKLGVDFDMDLACADGLLYPSSGRVTNPRTLTLVGTYRRLSFYEAAIAVDAGRERAYIFGGDSDAFSGNGSGTLYVYQQRSFQLVETHTFQPVRGAARTLIQASANTLALMTRVHGDHDGRLYLLHEQESATTSTTDDKEHPELIPVAQSAQLVPFTAHQFSLPASDVIYSPLTKRVYVSVTGTVGLRGNSIIPIDPQSGAVGQSIYVGSEPNRLAISDDGRFLWVGLDGAASIRQVDLVTGSVDAIYPLGRSEHFGWYYVDDLAIVPKKPDTVVVARKNRYTTVPHEGVAVYKNGAILPDRPLVRNGPENQVSTSDVIEFCDKADMLYGGQTQASGFYFTRMQVTDTGIKITDTTRSVFDWYDFDILCQGRLVVATNGQVIDPETRTEVAKYPGIIGGIWPNAFAYDPAPQRMYVISDDYHANTAAKLSVYDATTYTLLESHLVEGIPGEPKRMAVIDVDHLAVWTRDNTVYLLRRGTTTREIQLFIPQVLADVIGEKSIR
jgi:DNA-binding beta-propeller fold protein YncE